MNVSPLCTSHRCSSSSARSTTPWCRSSRTTSVSRLPSSGEIGSSRKRGTKASVTRSAMCSSRTLPSAMAATSETSSTTRRALAGSESQSPTRCGDRRRHHAVADDVLLEEVLPHELLEAPAELVLALGDQCGVRDRDAQRVLEERGHREPVGDRTDHRRLGAGVDEAPRPVATQRCDVHDGGQDEQRDGHRAHLSQPATARLVGARVGRDDRASAAVWPREDPLRRRID